MFGPSQVPTAGEPWGGVLKRWASRSPCRPRSLWKGTGCKAPRHCCFASPDPLRVLLCAAPFQARRAPGKVFPLAPPSAAGLLRGGSRGELAADAHLRTCSEVHPSSKATGGSFISCLRRDALTPSYPLVWFGLL